MGKIYYNGVDYSAPVVSGVSGIKGNAETTYRTGNVNLTPANLGAAPISHAVTTTTYGKGTGAIYGHVKLSDTYTSSVGDASSGVAASQKALFDAYSSLNSNLDSKFKSYYLLPAKNMPSNYNFNSCSVEGIYSSGGTSNQPNAPHNTDNGYLFVFSGTVIRQIWISLYQGNNKTRYYKNGQWSGWVDFG